MTVNGNMVINPLVKPANSIDHDVLMDRVDIFLKVMNGEVFRS